jgi:hypothetical protein
VSLPVNGSRLVLTGMVGLLILLTPVHVALAAADTEVLWYQEQTGEEMVMFSRETAADGERIAVMQRQKETTDSTISTPDGATISWHYTDPPDTDVKAWRTGDALHLAGTFKGRVLEETIGLDDDPWFQHPSYSLGRMALSESDSASFWIIRQDTLAIAALTAKRDKSETVTCTDDPLVAEKITIRPKGVLAPLWSGQYWFRKKDGLFLRYSGVHGPPGTAETAVCLSSRVTE